MKNQDRIETVIIKVTRGEKQEIKDLAHDAKMNLSAFLRHLVHQHQEDKRKSP